MRATTSGQQKRCRVKSVGIKPDRAARTVRKNSKLLWGISTSTKGNEAAVRNKVMKNVENARPALACEAMYTFAPEVLWRNLIRPATLGCSCGWSKSTNMSAISVES